MPLEKWQDRYGVSEEQGKSDSNNYAVPLRVLKSTDGRRFGLSPIPDEVYRIYFTAYDQLTILSASNL